MILDYLHLHGFFIFERHSICVSGAAKLGLLPISGLRHSSDCWALTFWTAMRWKCGYQGMAG